MRRPSGQCIVADVEDAAWFQLGIAHPRPDAVQSYEIDARHAGRQHLREALFEKRDVLNASRCRKPLRAGDMGWVEVHAPKRTVRVGGSKESRAEPVSAP